jgi:hypothetical protein
MEWVVVLLAAGAAVTGVRVWGARRKAAAAAAERAADLEIARQLADEDVTVLGEQLQRLDAEVADHPLDEAARRDYQTALDAYESAQRAVPRIVSADELSQVTDTLTAGRFALACVQARVAGEPLPERRTPCFFNPQHGPAVTDVSFTPPAHGTRIVPACAQDAARVERGERPDLRRVRLNGQLQPYWEAGAAYLPYGRNYFTEAALLASPQSNIGDGGIGGWSGG